MNNQPPKIPLRFLRWFCDPRLLPYVEGDLLELFEENQLKKGIVKSRWLFAFDVIKLFRPFMIKKFVSPFSSLRLLQTHLSSSLRTMKRQKFYAAIIISSMVVAFTLIQLLTAFLIKVDEVDDFVGNHSNKYRLMADDPFEKGQMQAYVLDDQVDYIKENYPSYKGMSNIYLSRVTKLQVEDVSYSQPITIGADANFLSFFGFKLLSGNEATAITHGGVVISQTMAKRLFGEADPVGQFVEAFGKDSSRVLQVNGVLDLESHDSHLEFDLIVHEKSFPSPNGGANIYLEFYDESDLTEFTSSLSNDTNMPYLWKSDSSHFDLQRLKEVYYDQKNGVSPFIKTISLQFVLVGWGVVGMILLISLLNFVNLFLLSSIKRRKELGIKKILGVSLASIRIALIVDIMIYLFIASTCSFVLSWGLIDQFNFRFEATLVEIDLFHPKVLLFLVAILIFILIVALLYAFSRINAAPMSMMIKSADFKVKINKYLLTPQFSVSMILGICSMLIMQQVEYIKNKPLGFDRDLISLSAKGEVGQRALKILKQQVLEERIVEKAALSSGTPFSGIGQIGIDLPDGRRYTPNFITGDQDIIQTLGMSITQSPSDTVSGTYVNEAFVKFFSWDDPIGKKLPGMSGNVSGVLADFNALSFYETIPPFLIRITDAPYHNLLLNYGNRSLNEVLLAVSEKWDKLLPGTPFIYEDIRVRIMEKHHEETRLLNVVVGFASGGILIASFGLFALSWSIIQNRTKEVGIRKVVGASMIQIISLLSIDYLKWVVFSFFIACPVAYLLTQKWLEHFAYRIGMLPEVFVIVGVATVLLALTIVGFHAAKVARINPVESLRDE